MENSEALPESEPQVSLPQPSSKKNLIIGSIALAVILVGTAAAAYYYYPPSSEKIAGRMTKAVAAANSMELAAKMDMEINVSLDALEHAESRQIKMISEFDGAIDSTDFNNQKFYGVLKVSGEGLVASMDLRGIGQVFYLKINEMPFLGFFDPGKIKNQWIKIDIQEVNKQLGLPEQGYKSLTEEQKKLITALYENSKIVKLTERLNSEKINSVAANHYRFTVDRQELKTLMTRVTEITNEQLTIEQKEEFAKLWDAFEFEPGEIWIGRKDNLPYKLVMRININSTENTPASGKMDLAINVRSYNQPVTLEPPSNSKSFEELFNETFGALNQTQEFPPIPVN